ncbi:MAG TPA: hypothetical protein PKW76_00115 [bacterium]|nr:hypothetical protein [bacterium]HPG44054.1 hypothetical protein [bacterium]
MKGKIKKSVLLFPLRLCAFAVIFEICFSPLRLCGERLTARTPRRKEERKN